MHMRGRIRQRTLATVVAVWVLGIIGTSATAFAQRGAMFVSNFASANVSVYSRTASGSTAPVTSINGLSGPHEVTVNPVTKEVIVANNVGFSISFYDADVTSATFGALKRTIAGPNTGLLWPLGVTVDRDHQELFVSNDDHGAAAYSITVYDLASLGAGGNVAPKRTITGPDTKLASPAGIAIDPTPKPGLPNGIVFVSNYDYFHFNGGPSIAVYPRDAQGDVAPVRTIQGLDTGLILPHGLVYDGFGKL